MRSLCVLAARHSTPHHLTRGLATLRPPRSCPLAQHIHFSHEGLLAFTTEVFKRCGIPEEDAHTASDVLISADLRGIECHGLARLHTHVGLLRSGAINPRPRVRVLCESKATLALDGDNGLGLVLAPFCARHAAMKADDVGTAWITIHNVHHLGIAGYHAMIAAYEPSEVSSQRITYPFTGASGTRIGFASSNSTPAVFPLSREPSALHTPEMHSTVNPLSIVFPAGEEEDVVIDMATRDAGWKTVEGHKGVCLATMVELLSAVLPGALAESKGMGIGHTIGAWRIDAFQEVQAFKRLMDHWIRSVRKSSTAVIPGEPERTRTCTRLEVGIPLFMPVLGRLHLLSQEMGIPLTGQMGNECSSQR